MSIPTVKSHSSFMLQTPVSRAPKRFAFEKWLWLPLLIFVSTASSAFGTLPGKPIPKRARVLTDNAYNATEQAYRDAAGETAPKSYRYYNRIGGRMLQPDTPSESYTSYAREFSEGIRKDFLEPNKVSSLVLSEGGDIPQKLDFRGAIKKEPSLFKWYTSLFAPLTTSFFPEDLEKRPGLSGLANRALKIIHSWYPPGTQLSLKYIQVTNAALGEDSSVNNVFHIDALHHAGATIPASEFPLEEGALWRAKGKRVVQLISLEDDGVKVRVIKGKGHGTNIILPEDELLRATCVSGKTTQIVPGLQISPNSSFFKAKPINPLSKYSVSVNPSFLFSGRVLHKVPFQNQEPNSPYLKHCNQIVSPIKRKRLAVFYEVESSKPSEYDEKCQFNLAFTTFAIKYIHLLVGTLFISLTALSLFNPFTT